MERPEDLLATREATSLARSILARMVVLGSLCLMGPLHLLGLVDQGVVAETDLEALTTMVVAALGLLASAHWRRKALARRDLRGVGTGIVSLDLLVLTALPLLWLTTGDEADPVPAFLLKNELFTIAVVLIVINALSLQPRYPAIMAAGAVALHLALVLFVLRDPRVQVTDSFHQHFNTAAVNLGLVTVRIGTLVLVGVLLSLITRGARMLVYDAVALQSANIAIREQQAELVMEGKMSAMASLVAGVAHELNSPLGAVSSSLQTAARAADKLAAEHDAERRKRMLRALADSAGAGQSAVERLSKLVASLKEFSALDRAEVQHVDLDECIASTLAVIDERLKEHVTIVHTKGALPALTCRPKELNQAFRTVIVNALEALQGAAQARELGAGQGIGRLTIESGADDAQVRVAIRDDGPGMPPARVASLFDVSISDKQERMGMGLGLLTARRIVERHGGRLELQSELGKGTTVTIALPLATPVHT